jgi:predicted nucleic acid-binding protein
MTANSPFLDTNILIRFLTGDVPEQAEQCRSLVNDLSDGSRAAWTSHFVIAEAVFTLSRYYGLDRESIAEKLGIIISLRGLRIDDKRMFREVFALYTEHPAIDYADCYHAALIQTHGDGRVLSYDKHFDRLRGVERIEPSDLIGKE